MGFFNRFKNIFARNEPAIQSQGIDPGTWLYNYVYGNPEHGSPVNIQTALSLSAFYACLKIRSETVSLLPFQLYMRDSKGNDTILHDHYLNHLVNREPNEIQTAFSYSSAECVNVDTKGCSIAKINYNQSGRPFAFDILKPEHVKIIKKDRKLYYRHENPEENINETLMSWEVFHLLNFSFDGINGINPIQAQKESLRKGINAQKYGNNYFANGTHNGGVLSTDKKPPSEGTPAEHSKGLVNYWNQQNAGLDKAGNPVVLWDGWKYEKTADNLQTSQLLDVLRLSVPDIARIFRIPIDMLDSRPQAVKQEEMMLQLKQGILPYLKMREAEYNRKLIPQNQKGKLFFKHNIKGLLQADSEAQARLLEMLFKVQAASPDDILKILDMPPRKDGNGGEYGLPFASNIKTEVPKMSLNGKQAVKN